MKTEHETEVQLWESLGQSNMETGLEQRVSVGVPSGQKLLGPGISTVLVIGWSCWRTAWLPTVVDLTCTLTEDCQLSAILAGSLLKRVVRGISPWSPKGKSTKLTYELPEWILFWHCISQLALSFLLKFIHIALLNYNKMLYFLYFLITSIWNSRLPLFITCQVS